MIIISLWFLRFNIVFSVRKTWIQSTTRGDWDPKPPFFGELGGLVINCPGIWHWNLQNKKNGGFLGPRISEVKIPSNEEAGYKNFLYTTWFQDRWRFRHSRYHRTWWLSHLVTRKGLHVSYSSSRFGLETFDGRFFCWRDFKTCRMSAKQKWQP